MRTSEPWPFCSTSRRKARAVKRSEEHTSELQSHSERVCRLLLEKKNIREDVIQEGRERSQSRVAPLMRATLVRLGQARCAFASTFHHYIVHEQSSASPLTDFFTL